LRIDSHHSFSDRYSLAYLESILKRNRIEGSVLVCPPDWTAATAAPGFVKAIIVSSSRLDLLEHPLARGIQHDFRSEEIPEWPAYVERLDVLHGLSLIPQIVERYPKLRLVIDHLGAPATPAWPKDLEKAAEFPQVYCKLSGLTAFDEPRRYVRHALAVFGPGRLMFGSDWPNGLPEHTWKAKLALFTQSIGAQTIEVREELLGGTALRFYDIGYTRA
jgi:predicted TIM-barrel fold metal-dependent hydrolase